MVYRLHVGVIGNEHERIFVLHEGESPDLLLMRMDRAVSNRGTVMFRVKVSKTKEMDVTLNPSTLPYWYVDEFNDGQRVTQLR